MIGDPITVDVVIHAGQLRKCVRGRSRQATSVGHDVPSPRRHEAILSVTPHLGIVFRDIEYAASRVEEPGVGCQRSNALVAGCSGGGHATNPAIWPPCPHDASEHPWAGFADGI